MSWYTTGSRRRVRVKLLWDREGATWLGYILAVFVVLPLIAIGLTAALWLLRIIITG